MMDGLLTQEEKVTTTANNDKLLKKARYGAKQYVHWLYPKLTQACRINREKKSATRKIPAFRSNEFIHCLGYSNRLANAPVNAR